jgi:hypothetical protein
MFLENPLNQIPESLIRWLAGNGFEEHYTEKEEKAILFIRLVLTDFYVNCVKPHNTIALNERTPFREYVIPLFKTFSAVYQNVVFQWYALQHQLNIQHTF